MRMNNKKYPIFLLLVLFSASCKKLVEIPEPANTITTSEAFKTQASANTAVLGIYNGMCTAGGGGNYCNGALSAYCGASADELNIFGAGTTDDQFQSNTLLATNGTVYSKFWAACYRDIYRANAVIEGCNASSTLTATVKNQFAGEAKFLRALIHFYLLNLFSDVPLVTTTAWANTDTFHRAPVQTIYQQIENDLTDAQNGLAEDYAVSGGERIRVNKAGATALLARVYLYEQKWDKAEAAASAVIENTGLYNLLDSLNDVFLANSNEAILQLSVPNVAPYATEEASWFITPDAFSNPNFYLTNSQLSAFETGDGRRKAWVDSTDFGGYYYYPFKYKVYFGFPGNITEYYMLLRLAEQYLIRAEARAHLNNLNPAIDDLNTIRRRAGLPDLSSSLTQPEVLTAVMQERRTELFAESGHRWFDLKRTGEADSVLSLVKPQWQPTQKLYPIPASELIRGPNLVQNQGY